MTALGDTIGAQAALLEPILDLDLGDAPRQLIEAQRIWLVGTGTSQHAAELGALMLQRATAPVMWRSGASFAGPGGSPREGDMVLVISHTAETLFARRARERATGAGATLLSITGRGRGWPEAIETIEPERSETYTASYLAALLVLARLASEAGLAPFDASQVSAIPSLVGEAARATPLRERLPERLLVVTGSGPGAITAREGALKLREASRLVAEGYEAEYLLHGNAVPLDARDGLIVLVPAEDPEGLVAALADAARAEHLDVVELTEPGQLHPIIAQFPVTVRLQALAAHLAEAGGCDPDRVITGAWASPRLWPDPAAG